MLVIEKVWMWEVPRLLKKIWLDSFLKVKHKLLPYMLGSFSMCFFPYILDNVNSVNVENIDNKKQKNTTNKTLLNMSKK